MQDYGSNALPLFCTEAIDASGFQADSLIRSNELKRFWLPLTPEDTLKTLILKADMLVELSGDRHHFYLEAFHVIDDILIPSFGS